MSSNFLSVGMNGVVQVNAVAVANLKNASFSIKNDNVEEYVCGGTNPNQPALLAATNQHAEIKAEQLWTDNNVSDACADSWNSSHHNHRPKRHNDRQPQIHFQQRGDNAAGPQVGPKSATSNSFSAKGILSAVGTFS